MLVMSVFIGVVSLEESMLGVSASLAVSCCWRDILIAYSIWSASDIMLDDKDDSWVRECSILYEEKYKYQIGYACYAKCFQLH